jgi:hypothetical protein
MKCPTGETFDRSLKMCRVKKSPGRKKQPKSSALEACEHRVKELKLKIEKLSPSKPKFKHITNQDVAKFFMPRP